LQPVGELLAFQIACKRELGLIGKQSAFTLSVCLCVSPLSLYPLFRPENILYRSKDPESSIAIADFGMCLFLHLSASFCSSFHRAKLLHFPDEQLTSLVGSFGYVAPEVIKNTGHGRYLVYRYCFPTHMHMQNTSSLLSPAQPSSPTLSSSATSLFVPTTPPLSPGKTLI